MQLPLQVTFRHMDPSPALESRVHELAGRLDRYAQEITSCRVVVEAPHRHHHQGNLFSIRLDITLPGMEIAVSRDPHDRHAHEDAYVALRDAFAAAARQLEQRVQRRRGDIKEHGLLPHGRIRELHPMLEYGRIETSDGRDVYFHRNSVVNAAFNGLAVGMPVHFVVEDGEHGPQASSVCVERRHHLVG